MQTILGIDPGLQHTGWGVIRSDNQRLQFVDGGCISPNTSLTMPERLLALHEALAQVIQAHKPDVCAIEETFVNKNPLSSLKLGHARGTLMLTVSQANIPVYEYAPTLIKKAVVGKGRADKEQVQAMVEVLLPGAKCERADTADALAVAICYSHHGYLTKLTGESW